MFGSKYGKIKFMKKTCLFCGKEFETKSKTNCCCHDHQLRYKNKLMYPDGSDFVECKLCGFRGATLHHHIKKFHSMTAEDYCKQFGIEEIELQSKSLRNHNSSMQKLAYKEGRLQGWGKGDKNPSCRKEVKEGRKSIFSENYIGYDGMTKEEKQQKISSLLKTLAENKKKNNTNPLTIEYYLAKGYTEEKAAELLKERQSTFTLKKCIEKYGEEKGREVFAERQKKWQNTLNSKPVEEIERINKLKASSSRLICGYSKISQKLFNGIFNAIKDEYNEIFYATNPNSLNNNLNTNNNSEYEVILEDGIHRYFLDFYVKDNNKVIEFDGDYWHSEKRGNQKRDKAREDKLKSLGYVNIFHVKEHDYRTNPNKVIEECLQFIRRK